MSNKTKKKYIPATLTARRLLEILSNLSEEQLDKEIHYIDISCVTTEDDIETIKAGFESDRIRLQITSL